jgi:hypothetical protein
LKVRAEAETNSFGFATLRLNVCVQMAYLGRRTKLENVGVTKEEERRWSFNYLNIFIKMKKRLRE